MSLFNTKMILSEKSVLVHVKLTDECVVKHNKAIVFVL